MEKQLDGLHKKLGGSDGKLESSDFGWSVAPMEVEGPRGRRGGGNGAVWLPQVSSRRPLKMP